MAKGARLTEAEEQKGSAEQHRYIIGEGKREHVDNIILRMLSMDARTPLSEIAKVAKVSKTTVFHELNRLIVEQDIKFVPEVNLAEMWERELVFSTKRIEKREFRQLKIHGIGFGEFLCFISFPKKKPTDEQILSSVSKARGLHVPQYIGRILEAQYDIIMYLVARNTKEVTDFMTDFQKNLPEGCEAKRYAFQILRTHGFFPLRDELISQFKISDRYKKMLLILNQNARGELSKMGMKKDMVTYLYRALLNYGILERVTLYIKKPKYSITGIIRFDFLDSRKWTNGFSKWAKRVISQDYLNGSYVFMADIFSPFGGLLIVNAKDSLEFENIKNTLEDPTLGIRVKKSMLISGSILGSLGIRNFDMAHSRQHIALEERGFLPRVNRMSRVKAKKHGKPEFFDLED